jgi:DNA-binding transcriptional ArsR family regulator
MSRSLGAVFAALANEPRRKIVARLSRGSMTTPAIGRQFRFSKQALSRHVGVLEDAGLVERRSHGRVHELALVPAPLDGVTQWVDEVRRGWNANLDRLDALLRHGDE